MSFTDKVVIVTGASSGIGAAAAIAFARDGAKVVLVGRNETKLAAVTKQCEGYGKKPLVIKADVAIDVEAKTIVKRTVDHFGQLDILVNNAGIANTASMLDEKLMEVFDKVMNTNLRAAVLLTHLAAPHLIKTKGNVINISSVIAFTVGPNYTSYAVSKAGMDHFTRSAALDFSRHGVRVNSVNPGPVNTDIAENSGITVADVPWDVVKDFTALNRISEPDEIADLISFLASDKARAITGSCFVSDNGMLLKK